jgi:CO/xanthine dehydrogenase FAD-binding subunit
VRGNRSTARAADELATAILMPHAQRPSRSTFLKLGARRYLVISIVMVAAVAEFERDGRVAAARVAVGACSAAAVRLPKVETLLVGQRPGPDAAKAIEAEHLDAIAPIDDVRGSGAYRRDAALTLVRRAILELAA